jgi:formate--tetrahydrofolate ligase
MPEAAVLVATIRALKMNGGAKKTELAKEDLKALEKGVVNLEHHIKNVRQFGMELVVAINRFGTDTDAELEMVRAAAEKAGARVALCEVFAKGGAGGETLAKEVLDILKGGKSNFKPLYDAKLPIKAKIDAIVKNVYGGDGAEYSAKAERAIAYLESIGLAETPICMAKTQYSLSDDATKLGRPTGFKVTVNDVYPVAGAGFVVAQCGEIMTMPGLPKVPAAERMKINPDGSIEGLF